LIKEIGRILIPVYPLWHLKSYARSALSPKLVSKTDNLDTSADTIKCRRDKERMSLGAKRNGGPNGCLSRREKTKKKALFKALKELFLRLIRKKR